MSEFDWQLGVALLTGLFVMIGARFYRRWAEARRVDKLLKDVVKDMDAFRR